MLEKLPLFEGLSFKELEEIEGISKRINYRKGEIIFSQGAFARDFYVIESGQVEISVKDMLQASKTIAVLKNGDFFGEMALFDKNSLRSGTATSLQNTNLVMIPGTEFEQLLHTKPSISFKLLGALSKRLKRTYSSESESPPEEVVREAKIVTVAAPRNGWGKSLFSTSLAQLISHELPKRVLFVDLDLHFSEGSFYMGVFSPRNIGDLAPALKKGPLDFEGLVKFLVKHSDNLFSLPAPNNFIDGDKVDSHDILSVVKTFKNHFDYIIIDTDSDVDEIFLNAVDLADYLIFLVDTRDVLKIKTALRYFQGLAKLNYPEENVYILENRITEEFVADKISNIFRYKVFGGLPEIKDFVPQYGLTPYQHNPSSPYTNMLRVLLTQKFKEQNLKTQEKVNFFYKWLFRGGTVRKIDANGDAVELKRTGDSLDLEFSEDSLSIPLKFIRTSIIYGNYEEAKTQVMRLLEFCQQSPILYQILGEIMVYQGLPGEAINPFRQAILLDGENYMAMGFLAKITADEQLFKKALTILENRVGQHPKFPDLWNEMGKLFFQRDDFEKGAECFRKALSLHPDYLEAKINLSVALGEQKAFNDALNELNSIFPKNIRVFYLMGKYFYSMGKLHEALESFKLTEEIDPNYLDVKQWTKKLGEYFQKLSSLIEIHEQIQRSHPTFPDLHNKMGMFYSLVGKFEEAEDEFKKAIQLNPNYESAQKQLLELNKRIKYRWNSDGPMPIGEGIPSAFSQQKIDLEIIFEPDQLASLSRNPESLFLVNAKNNRTGKHWEWVLKRGEIGVGGGVISGIPQTGVHPNDILLVYLYDQLSGNLLLALPHWVSEKNLAEKRIAVTVSSSYKSIVASNSFYTPVRYFLVTFISEKLASELSGDSPKLKALLWHSRTNISFIGSLNPEHSSEIQFLLVSGDDKDVVKAGDLLLLKILDMKDEEIFKMSIPVNPSNIEAFNLTVFLDRGSGEASEIDRRELSAG